MPLPKETPLAKFPEGDLRRVLLARGLQRLGLALCQRGRPIAPVLPAVGVSQGHEQGVVVQPIRLSGLKRGQVGKLCIICCNGKTLSRFFKARLMV